jgi:hypothetical protein
VTQFGAPVIFESSDDLWGVEVRKHYSFSRPWLSIKVRELDDAPVSVALGHDEAERLRDALIAAYPVSFALRATDRPDA